MLNCDVETSLELTELLTLCIPMNAAKTNKNIELPMTFGNKMDRTLKEIKRTAFSEIYDT